MTQLSSLVEINPAPDPLPADGPVSVIGLADISQVSATAAPRVVAGPDELPSARRTARPGDVLFARISPSMENGKVAIAPAVETPSLVVSAELMVLRPRSEEVDPRMIWAFLRQRPVRSQLKAFMRGSGGHQRLHSEAVAQVELTEPTPGRWSLADEAIAHLDRARLLQASILELVRELPAATARSAASGRRRLPLGQFEVDLRHGTNEKSAGRGGLPVLRIPNIVDRRIKLDDLRYIDGDAASESEILAPDDLLLVRTSGSPARLATAAVYEAQPAPATFASYLIRIRAADLDSDFLWAWLQTAEARSTLLSQAATSSGRYNLNISIVRALPVPLLGPEEQGRVAIVARHARRLAAIGTEREALLDQAVAATLEATFADSALADPAAAQRGLGPETMFLPEVFAVASPRQKDLWAKMTEPQADTEEERGAELGPDYAWRQHNLRLLEQLGVVVRERDGDAQSWRRPDPELEIIG